MASSTQSGTANQPLTPPTEPPSSTNGAPSQINASHTAPSTVNLAPPTTTASTTIPAAAPSTDAAALPSLPSQVPATSLRDSGKSRRPRDVRLIHMLLASVGVTAYQERVPLQLLDFAYRYTSSVLQDAVHLVTEGYAGAVAEPTLQQPSSGRGGGGGGGGGAGEVTSVSLQALRLSIASRLHYQFQTGLPKEFLMDVAAERNRIALPGATRYGGDAAAEAAGEGGGVVVGGGGVGGWGKTGQHGSVMMGGLRLPPERFCLTGTGWNVKDEWESEGDEEIEDILAAPGAASHGSEEALGGGEGNGAGGDVSEGEGENDDMEDGEMEDVFGHDTAMEEAGADEDGDKAMTDV